MFQEKMTGTKASRPQLDLLLTKLRVGDTVIIESFSRLGRSLKDLLNLMDKFQALGVTLVSLKESLDMSTPTGKLLSRLMMSFAEFERDTIVQRTNEGLASARARGRVGGRPRIDDKKVQKAVKLYQAGAYSIKEIVAMSGVSRASLYRALEKNP